MDTQKTRNPKLHMPTRTITAVDTTICAFTGITLGKHHRVVEIYSNEKMVARVIEEAFRTRMGEYLPSAKAGNYYVDAAHIDQHGIDTFNKVVARREMTARGVFKGIAPSTGNA